MTFIKQNVLLTIVTVGVIGGLLYYTLGMNNSSSSSTLLISTGDSSSSPASQKLLTSLTSLSTITLDSSIFTDPVFVSLTNFGVVIPPENVGRHNPFASFGNSVPQSQTTKLPVPTLGR